MELIIQWPRAQPRFIVIVWAWSFYFWDIQDIQARGFLAIQSSKHFFCFYAACCPVPGLKAHPDGRIHQAALSEEQEGSEAEDRPWEKELPDEDAWIDLAKGSQAWHAVCADGTRYLDDVRHADEHLTSEGGRFFLQRGIQRAVPQSFGGNPGKHQLQGLCGTVGSKGTFDDQNRKHEEILFFVNRHESCSIQLLHCWMFVEAGEMSCLLSLSLLFRKSWVMSHELCYELWVWVMSREAWAWVIIQVRM